MVSIHLSHVRFLLYFVSSFQNSTTMSLLDGFLCYPFIGSSLNLFSPPSLFARVNFKSVQLDSSGTNEQTNDHMKLFFLLKLSVNMFICGSTITIALALKRIHSWLVVIQSRVSPFLFALQCCVSLFTSALFCVVSKVLLYWNSASSSLQKKH